MSGFKELTSSISATIRAGATVKIPSVEKVVVMPGYTGVIGIRKPVADKGLLLGSTLVRGGYADKVELHLYNGTSVDYEVRVNDPIANIEAFENSGYALKVYKDE